MRSDVEMFLIPFNSGYDAFWVCGPTVYSYWTSGMEFIVILRPGDANRLIRFQ